MVEDIRTDSESSAPFNSAIATLMRLDRILTDIKVVSTTDSLFSGQKQEMLINLTKQLFFQAIPLLKEDFIKENKEKIINLSPKMRELKEQPNLINPFGKHKGVIVDFSPEIESELNNLWIDIQQHIASQGYFMPPKNDPRYALRG